MALIRLNQLWILQCNLPNLAGIVPALPWTKPAGLRRAQGEMAYAYMDCSPGLRRAVGAGGLLRHHAQPGFVQPEQRQRRHRLWHHRHQYQPHQIAGSLVAAASCRCWPPALTPRQHRGAAAGASVVIPPGQKQRIASLCCGMQPGPACAPGPHGGASLAQPWLRRFPGRNGGYCQAAAGPQQALRLACRGPGAPTEWRPCSACPH